MPPIRKNSQPFGGPSGWEVVQKVTDLQKKEAREDSLRLGGSVADRGSRSPLKGSFERDVHTYICLDIYVYGERDIDIGVDVDMAVSIDSGSFQSRV